MAWRVKSVKSSIVYNVKTSGKWLDSEIRSDILEELLRRLEWRQNGEYLETATMRVPMAKLVSDLTV